MMCPVCDEFFLNISSKDDIEEGIDGLDKFCPVCGWKYNLEQINDPKAKNSDGYDIAELKKQFLDLRKKNKYYNYLDAHAPKQEHSCPVCGKYVFKNINDHDICPYCHWENDSYCEEYPDDDGGANSISLNERKRLWNLNHKN